MLDALAVDRRDPTGQRGRGAAPPPPRRVAPPAPVRQHRVHDTNGKELARLDVAWPQRKVAVEYDSRAHHGPRRIEHDENRWTRVEALGWTIVPVTRIDLRPGELRPPEPLTGCSDDQPPDPVVPPPAGRLHHATTGADPPVVRRTRASAGERPCACGCGTGVAYPAMRLVTLGAGLS